MLIKAFWKLFHSTWKYRTICKRVQPRLERMAILRLNTKPLNIVLVCVHAPTEMIEDEIKDEFYNKLKEKFDIFPGNVIELVLGDLNAKCWREIHFTPMIGKESSHAINNENGWWLISFTVSKNIVVRSITFPHKNIHKATWKSSDGKRLNQIDHVLIQNRFRSCITDIISYRGVVIIQITFCFYLNLSSNYK